MIDVNNVRKTYPPDKIALKGISFEIKSGDVCGYIGANGAGKSTTVKILTGVLDFEKGTAIVGGIDVKKNPIEVKRIMGYVPESANLFNSLTVNEFLDFIGTVRDLDKETLKKRKDYFAELFDFKNQTENSIGSISKGNRQKVLITSALMHNPQVIFLDEPLNGLDANSIFTFQDMIKKLSEKGKTIFYCSHLLDTIEKISTRIIIIENGEIKLDKTTEDLKNSDDFVSLENLFRSMNKEEVPFKFCYEDIFN